MVCNQGAAGSPSVWAVSVLCVALVVLCALGVWQVQRLTWKQGVVADLEAAYRTDGGRAVTVADVSAGQIVYGTVAGIADFSKALLLVPRVHEGRIGASLIVPVVVSLDLGNSADEGGVAVGGERRRTMFVNMGWTDLDLAGFVFPAAPRHIVVRGLVRPVYWSVFTPDNQPEDGVWYRPDTQEMARVLRAPPAFAAVQYADKIEGVSLPGLPLNPRWSPPNNHLYYAVFWFTMAGVLLLIFAIRFYWRGDDG